MTVIRSRYEAVTESRNDCVPVGETMTKQAEAWQHDINVIMAKYIENPDPRVFNANPARYGDVSDFGDFQRCMEKVKTAEAAFLCLPAIVRERFGNDPAKLVAAAFDPGQKSVLEELGLLEPGEMPKASSGVAPVAPPMPSAAAVVS